jgi:hypothetical protein
MFTQYKILGKIISDKDLRFIVVFWKIFIVLQGIYIIVYYL